MIAAGDVILIPAGLVHSFEAQEDIDAIAVLPAGAKTFAPDGSLMAQRVEMFEQLARAQPRRRRFAV